MSLKSILIKETVSVIALFAFFLLVLVAVAALAYLLIEFGSRAVTEILGVTGLINLARRTPA